MKNAVMITLVLGALTSAGTLVVLAGESCPEQEFGSLDGYNADLIATDPISGRKLLLPQAAHAIVGVPSVVTGWVCDDDAKAGKQTLKLIRGDTNQEIPIDPNDWTYSFTVTYQTPGTKFIPFELTDGVQIRRGTKVVYAEINRPPILH